MSDKHIELRECAIAIIGVFEELLEQKDITIPSNDREGDEDEARLYGTEYYIMEDEIVEILAELVKTVQEKPEAIIKQTLN